MKKYLEIISYKEKSVVKRLDVTNESERNIERIETGININLNHDEYYTWINESETVLEII